MMDNDNESIIPPGVDSLPRHSSPRKSRSVQRDSKAESNKLRKLVLDKCSESRPIHKASPMRSVLAAANKNDHSDVDRLSHTLVENRKKAEPLVHMSGGYCSSVEVQQFADSIRHVDIAEKSLQSDNNVSYHRTSESDSNDVLLKESTFDRKDHSNNESLNDVDNTICEPSEDVTTDKECMPQFGPDEDMASEHSTQRNISCDSVECNPRAALSERDSDEGSLEYGDISPSPVQKRNALRKDQESSDDSSVEDNHKDNDWTNQRRQPQTLTTEAEESQLKQAPASIYEDCATVDKLNMSTDYDANEFISLDDVINKASDALPIKKKKTKSCDESSDSSVDKRTVSADCDANESIRLDDDVDKESDDLLIKKKKTESCDERSDSSLMPTPLQAILSQALSNTAMEIDLRKVPPTDRVYFLLDDVDSNPHPSPYPVTLKDPAMCFGHKNYVKVPWSIRNIEKTIENGCERKERGWVNVRLGLSHVISDGLSDISDFKVAMQTYKPLMKFDGLLEYYDSLHSKKQHRMLKILVATASLVLKSPQLFTQGLSFLISPSSESRLSATFSREQCACLLANSFFCTFPETNHSQMNDVNMSSLMSSPSIAAMKMNFFLAYFEAVTKEMPIGCVTFSRRTIRPSGLPIWDNLDIPLKQVETTGTAIEDMDGCLQVDFANKFIGGGVLSSGAVQEEIRFLICPEMIVSLFICPKMNDNEAIHIYGAQRFSNYTGYGSSLKWKKFCPEKRLSPEKRDIYGRTTCELVAIDAIQFAGSGFTQYKEDNLLRELNKAYVGFFSDCENPRPVATGNWGCGVFGGDKEFKSLIQIMAASLVGRDIIYVPYDDPSFGKSLYKVCAKLRKRNITVGMLYNILMQYRPKTGVTVFDFVMTETVQYTTMPATD